MVFVLLIWMICGSLYDRVIPYCGCFYIRSKSFCLQVQGIFLSLCCLVTTPTGVPASVGTPHLTIIALCNHKVRPNKTDTRQKAVLKAKPGEKRLFACFHKPQCAQAPYKDHQCCFQGQMCCLLRHCLFWMQDYLYLQHGNAEKTEFFSVFRAWMHLPSVWRWTCGVYMIQTYKLWRSEKGDNIQN